MLKMNCLLVREMFGILLPLCALNLLVHFKCRKDEDNWFGRCLIPYLGRYLRVIQVEVVGKVLKQIFPISSMPLENLQTGRKIYFLLIFLLSNQVLVG